MFIYVVNLRIRWSLLLYLIWVACLLTLATGPYPWGSVLPHLLRTRCHLFWRTTTNRINCRSCSASPWVKAHWLHVSRLIYINTLEQKRMVNLSWGVQMRTFLSSSDRRPNNKGIGAQMNKRMSNSGITSKFSLLCDFLDQDKGHDEISWISSFSWP